MSTDAGVARLTLALLVSSDASHGYVGGMGLRPINEAQPVPVE
jgi:hypothetical protein